MLAARMSPATFTSNGPARPPSTDSSSVKVGLVGSFTSTALTVNSSIAPTYAKPLSALNVISVLIPVAGSPRVLNPRFTRCGS